MKYSYDMVIRMYNMMVKIRTFEKTASDLFYEGRIPGSLHVYLGQEASATGVMEALRPDDFVLTTHRGHGVTLAKGADPKYMMAELFGKSTGYCKGKGGSMHIAAPQIGLLGANSIVGAGINIALGPALFSQYKKTGQVSVCFFGDGASNQGTFHESLNLSATWKLPVIYICENNLYGMSVSKNRHQSIDRLSDRAIGYNMPGITVDGNNPFKVYEAARKAVEQARAGEGPSLIEVLTYLHNGHSEGFTTMYRPADEVACWMKRDPVKLMEQYMLENGIADQETIKVINKKNKAIIDEAVKFAQDSPLPGPKETLEDIYTDIIVEGRSR